MRHKLINKKWLKQFSQLELLRSFNFLDHKASTFSNTIDRKTANWTCLTKYLSSFISISSQINESFKGNSACFPSPTTFSQTLFLVIYRINVPIRILRLLLCKIPMYPMYTLKSRFCRRSNWSERYCGRALWKTGMHTLQLGVCKWCRSLEGH